MITKKIYAQLKQIIPSFDKDYYKLKSAGFMDLNIDVLERDENFLTIALSHYYLHDSGDLIPDPDMEVRISLTDETAFATSFQDLYNYTSIYEANQVINVKKASDLNSFLLYWLNNIKEQGHQ